MRNDDIFTGCIPALMMPSAPRRQPDFDGLVAESRRRTGDGRHAAQPA